MKVLGIDPGTAALGYGIVERTGGRLREVDHGCLTTSPDLPLPERLLAIHALVDELLALHEPDLMGVERLFFSRNVQTALGVGQARGVVLLAAAQHGTPVREATPNEVKSAIAGYGAADKEQVAADGPAGPRDERAAATRRRRRRPGHRDLGRQHGPRRGGRRRPAVMDRAAVAPITRGETGYERAVREALAAERARPRRQAQRVLAADRDDRLGRGRRSARSPPIRSSSRSAGIGYRVFAAPAVLASAQPGGRLKLHTYHLVREDQQALYGFRSAEELGFFTLLLTVNGVGPKVALAIVGSRPTPDLQLAIMAQDQAVLVAIPGIGKKLAERIIFELKEKVTAAGRRGRRGRRCRARAASEGEIVAALQALGYSLAEAREASRAALADVGVEIDARGAGQGRAAEPRSATDRPPSAVAVAAIQPEPDRDRRGLGPRARRRAWPGCARRGPRPCSR